MIYSDNLAKLIDSGVENASGELTSLIAFSAGITYDEALRLRLMSDMGTDCYETVLGSPGKAVLEELVRRRISGEPLQYITGECWFYGRRFISEPGVLIPRFDTECVVEYALSLLGSNESVLDLCCGSGCIGLTLALEKDADVCFADISAQALALTERNARLHGFLNIKTVQTDVFRAFPGGVFDMIISNPPYIPTGDIEHLSREVRREPFSALDGGEDGLDFYRRIASACRKSLADGGRLVFECGIGQNCAVEHIMKENGFENIVSVKDLNGIYRAVGGYIGRG